MISKILKIIEDKKDLKIARNRYIKERKRSLVRGCCENCKFVKCLHWSDGSVSFTCKINGELPRWKSDSCEYKKEKQ